MLLVSWRKRVGTIAVLVPNPSVRPVYYDLALLVYGNLSRCLDCVCLGSMGGCHPFVSLAPNGPAILMGDYVLIFAHFSLRSFI